MSIVRLMEYHCDLCGDPVSNSGAEFARGLQWNVTGVFSLVPIETAEVHICGPCWHGLAAAIASEKPEQAK